MNSWQAGKFVSYISKQLSELKELSNMKDDLFNVKQNSNVKFKTICLFPTLINRKVKSHN
jgi:hypothetical protein